MTSLRDIKKGEAVTNNYQPDVLHRNDMSFYIYGFIEEANFERLCAIDLPTYNPEQPFGQTKANDGSFYGPQGRFNTRPELARLEALLGEMKTSVEEDEAILKGGKLKTWQDETIVRFRMGRKKALQRAVATVREELGKAEGGGDRSEL